MEYLIGSLMTAVFFVLLYGAYYLGTKQRKPKTAQVDDELERKREQLKKDFDAMMNYNYETALRGEKK